VGEFDDKVGKIRTSADFEPLSPISIGSIIVLINGDRYEYWVETVRSGMVVVAVVSGVRDAKAGEERRDINAIKRVRVGKYERWLVTGFGMWLKWGEDVDWGREGVIVVG
jgi:hypothetical protein